MSARRNDSLPRLMPSTRSLKTFFVLAVILLPAVIQGYPHSDRLSNENSMEGQDGPNVLRLIENNAGIDEEGLLPTKVRQKRLSDQRRAELETLMALSKMTGKLATVSRGGRQLDPQKIGRRRRSITEKNIKNLQYLLRLLGNFNPKENAAYPLIS